MTEVKDLFECHAGFLTGVVVAIESYNFLLIVESERE